MIILTVALIAGIFSACSDVNVKNIPSEYQQLDDLRDGWCYGKIEGFSKGYVFTDFDSKENDITNSGWFSVHLKDEGNSIMGIRTETSFNMAEIISPLETPN